MLVVEIHLTELKVFVSNIGFSKKILNLNSRAEMILNGELNII